MTTDDRTASSPEIDAGDPLTGASRAALPPSPPAGLTPPAEMTPPLPAPPLFDQVSEAPEPWTPPDRSASPVLVDASIPWEMVDPGRVTEGTWRSPGYASSSMRAALYRIAIVADIVSVIVVIGLRLALPGLQRAANEGHLATGQIALINTVLRLEVPATLIVSVAVVACLWAWLSRVVDNIPPLTGRTPEHSPRMAMVAWIIPVVSFIIPYQILASTLLRLRVSERDGTARWLLPWWVLKTVSGVTVYGLSMAAGAAGNDALLGLSVVMLAGGLVGDVGLIVLVTEIGRREAIHATRLGLGGPGRQWPAFVPGWGGSEDVEDFDDEDAFDDEADLASRDPLARQPGELAEDYHDRLVASLETEGTRA